MTNQFLRVIQELAVRLESDFNAEAFNKRVEEALAADNLSHQSSVPEWLIRFFGDISQGREVNSATFTVTNAELQQARHWLSFAETILGGEWEFDGEMETVAFDAIGVQGLIDNVGKSYEIITY